MAVAKRSCLLQETSAAHGLAALAAGAALPCTTDGSLRRHRLDDAMDETQPQVSPSLLSQGMRSGPAGHS